MILIINCGSNKTPKFGEILSTYGIESNTITLDDLEEFNSSLYKGVIVSGAPILLTEVDHEPYLQKLGFIKSVDIPVLGVCFGHQIMGLLHGAEVSRCPEDRDWQTIKFSDDALLVDYDQSFEMMEDHCECISLPDAFRVVGSSDVCEVEAMEHISKRLYGVQFHPEVSCDQGKALLKKFCDVCLK